jgi:hypothetical protein
MAGNFPRRTEQLRSQREHAAQRGGMIWSGVMWRYIHQVQGQVQHSFSRETWKSETHLGHLS